MKTKLKATTYALLMILSLSNALKAEELALPVITRPSSLDEGTQTKLSSAQVTEIAPWARDSKVFLNDLLEGSVNLSTFDKHERLVNGIKFVVGESSPRNNELFMRYILNRSLVLDAILEKEMDPNEAGTIDVKLGLLLSSIKMAQKYFDCDMSMMTKNDSAQFADFGKDYFKYLIKLNKSVFDASAEYAVEKTALEWLQWDLYRDLNNKQYASAIIKINNALRNFTDKKIILSTDI